MQQCARYKGEDEKWYRILIGKPLRNFALRRQKKWEDNNKLKLKEIGWKVDDTVSGLCPAFGLYHQRIFFTIQHLFIEA
jgi:hypothetical protein